MALLHVDFFSNVLGQCMEMDVLLPEQTRGQIGAEGRAGDEKCATLYLLHGMSDNHTIWQRMTSIERYTRDLGVAVVMPKVHLGWYTDMWRGGKYFTYISEEIPAVCEQFFGQLSHRREDRYVAGLSMGGYGALKCALCAPQTFSRAASLSGAADIASSCEALARDGQYAGTMWENVFGPVEKVRGSENDLLVAAERVAAQDKWPKPELYMWCGTEDFLYEANVCMREHLTKLGYPLRYEESPGDHQWKYWDEKIQTVLEWLPIGKD